MVTGTAYGGVVLIMKRPMAKLTTGASCRSSRPVARTSELFLVSLPAVSQKPDLVGFHVNSQSIRLANGHFRAVQARPFFSLRCSGENARAS